MSEIEKQINRYDDLTLHLEAELGRRVMSVREVLGVSEGSVIALPRAVGSKIDVQVGGAPFGSAELVQLGGGLALRFATFTHDESRTSK
jgi:flagellar motor switch/type III secretory pathway protein FliN